MSRTAWGPRATLALALALSGTGCTAGLATVRLVSADKAVRIAAEAGADDGAPYEYTLAERYLAEAVSQSMRSQYRDSIDLARKAEAHAAAALDATTGSRSIEIDKAGEDITEEDLEEVSKEEDDGRKADDLADEEFDSLDETLPDAGTSEEEGAEDFGEDGADDELEIEDAP